MKGKLPENWLPFDEFFKTIPKRPMGACMVLRDEAGKILMLDSNYRDGWVFPGGLAEQNESPKEAAERETFEETGLKKEAKRLLVVNHTILQNGEASMVFTFDGGIVTEAEKTSIRIDEENDAFEFMEIEDAIESARRKTKDRLKYALKALETKSAYYFESK